MQVQLRDVMGGVSPSPSKAQNLRKRPNSAAVQGANPPRPPSNLRPNSASSNLSSLPAPQKKKNTLRFISNAEEQDSILPRPLPPGMAYVASYTSFEELIAKHILTQEDEEKVHLSISEVAELYRAKCKDQGLQVSKKRECRYIQLLSQNCKGLQFCLKENGLGHHSAECIASILAENEHFSILDLSGNSLKDAGAIKIAELLMVNDALVHVALKSNDIGSIGGEKIAEALEANNTVTSLDLSGLSGINRNHLGVNGARALGRALAVNSTLASLHLGANGLGNEGLHLVALGLEGNRSLTELDLGSNNLGWEACTALGHVLVTTEVKSLNLERNDLRDKGLSVLAQTLKSAEQCPADKLEVLNLSHNNIKTAGFTWLGNIIRIERSLRVLKLDGNECGHACSEIAAAMRDTRSLQHLTLSRCDIGPEQGACLADALCSQSSLTRVELNDNLLRDEGIITLVAALHANTTLKHLDIGNNKICDAGGAAIATMLQNNRQLQNLCVRQNYLKLSGDSIAEALRLNTTLLELDFTYNDFSFKSFSRIGTSLQNNVAKWRKQAAPRLLSQIDSLKVDEATLHGTQEDIVQEIKRREVMQENLTQRKEHIKQQVATFAQNVKDLEERVANTAMQRAKGDEALAVRGEDLQRQKQRLENIRRKIETKIKTEEEKAARIKKELARIERDVEVANNPLEGNTDKETGALQQELRQASKERTDAEAVAKKLAEELAKAELRVQDLERKSKEKMKTPQTTERRSSKTLRKKRGSTA